MPTITLNLPAAHLTRVVDFYARDYAALLPDGTPNPQTRGEFARQQIVQVIRGQVMGAEGDAGRRAIVTPLLDIT